MAVYDATDLSSLKADGVMGLAPTSEYDYHDHSETFIEKLHR